MGWYIFVEFFKFFCELGVDDLEVDAYYSVLRCYGNEEKEKKNY